jgi:hypothetical protein
LDAAAFLSFAISDAPRLLCVEKAVDYNVERCATATGFDDKRLFILPNARLSGLNFA